VKETVEIKTAVLVPKVKRITCYMIGNKIVQAATNTSISWDKRMHNGKEKMLYLFKSNKILKILKKKKRFL